jgi:hypothetical protein
LIQRKETGGTIMFINTEKRIQEIIDTRESCLKYNDDFYAEIIFQEKAMIKQAIKDECNKCYGVGIMGYKPAIEQAKKEAREEMKKELGI